jgi:hypothetical protein
MTTGFLQIIEPLAVSAITTSSMHATQANLLTPDPKEVWAPGGVGSQDLVLDLGSAQDVDSVFLGFTNAANVTIAARAISATGPAPSPPGIVGQTAFTSIRAADAKSVRSSVLLKAAAPYNTRYVGVTVTANGVNWSIGRLAAGLSFEASWDREWGSGRQLIDTARVTALAGGGFGVQPGARKAAYEWTFGDLTEAELEQLWGIAYRVGASSPIIVVEHDGAGALQPSPARNERLHYGLFRKLDKFERRDPSATKWQLGIEEWI